MEENWLENATSNGGYTFGIIDAKTDELVGNIGLMDIDHINREATLGIFIGEEKYRSKGYGSEAINLILEYGFRYINLHNINLSVNSYNERAIKCYEKVGFKKSGFRREAVFNNGKYYDQLFYDYLDNDFKGDFIENKVKRD